MHNTQTYNPALLTHEVALPIAADGSISVWFADCELRFATEASAEEYSISYSGAESVSRAKLITFLQNNKTVVVLSADPLAAFEAFASQMIWVEAAGGIAENEHGEVVMIYRNNRWDLPKGHREQGETFAQCAVREVEEETGVKVTSVVQLLTTTLHAYKLYGRWELKLTAWYAMRATRRVLRPQSEEGIARAEWVALKELAKKIKDTFPTIKRVFSAFLH